MRGRRWMATGLAVSALAFVALLLTGQDGTLFTPPLLLAIAMAAALGGLLPGIGVGAVGWLVASLGRGPGVTRVYLAVMVGAVVLLSDRAAAELRHARDRADRQRDLLGVLLSMLRRVAESRGRRGAEASVLDALDGVPGAGLRVLSVADLDVGGSRAFRDEAEFVVEAVLAAAHDAKPRFVQHGTRGGLRHLAALPVVERGDVVAVITALRRETMPPSERVVLREFSATLGHVLTNLHEERSGELVLQLVQHDADLPDAATMGRALLEITVSELALWGGAVLRYRGGRFVAEAVVGDLPDGMRALLTTGLAYGQSAVWEVYRGGKPVYIEDYQASGNVRGGLLAYGVASLAMVPVGTRPPSHVVLLLVHDARRSWLASEKSLLADLSQVLRTAVEQHDAENRLEELGRLQRELLATPVAAMYEHLLEAAVRLVPGSQAASLLLRADDGRFRFAATVGYDTEGLAPIALPPDAMQAWYGADREGWARGEPRIFGADHQRSVREVSAELAPRKPFKEAGRIDEIVANLCLPVVHGGEVLAVLNLDAMQDPDAFEGSAMDAARGLAPFLAFLLHESDVRRQLAETARTDALTGLSNRRAFDEQAGHDVSRAVRYEEPLALLLLDLSRFKRVNDRFGHAAGDEALRAVGEALRNSARAGDRVYRWGGDEFALVLAHADAGVARAVAGRVAEAVDGVRTPAGSIGVNIGVACVPGDGADLATLLRVADERMFRAKATGRATLRDPDDG